MTPVIRGPSAAREPGIHNHDRFKISDATGIVSDVMDELGIPSGVVGAHILRPTIAHSRSVGPALTVRNVLQRAATYGEKG